MAQTSEEFEFLKRVYQNLDRRRRLEPGNAYYHLYHPVYTEMSGDDPIKDFKSRIRMSDVESLHYFSGFRGSGKTTELLRLKQGLEEDGYLVLYADAGQYLNLNLPIEISDLLIVLAGAFSDAVEKDDPALRPAHDSYWAWLLRYLTTTELEWKDYSFARKDPASLKASLRVTPNFRERVQIVMSTRLAELEGETKNFFKDCVRTLRQKRPGIKIVFLFDQLENLRGSRLTDPEVLASVERVFRQHRERLNLPSIHAVYTVPPWLKFTLPGTPITILPSVRQWENDELRTPYEAGNRCVRRVLEKRFGGEAELMRFFGSDAAVSRLVDVCGGHFEDLFELARTAVARTESLPVTAKTLESAIVEVRRYYLPVAVSDAVWLQEIAERRTDGLQTAHPEDVNRFTLFLDTHLVLFLRNGEDWYDVHPLIREEIAAKARRAVEGAVPVSNG